MNPRTHRHAGCARAGRAGTRCGPRQYIEAFIETQALLALYLAKLRRSTTPRGPTSRGVVKPKPPDIETHFTEEKDRFFSSCSKHRNSSNNSYL